MSVLAIVDDLLFLAKCEAAAAHAGVALRTAVELTGATPLLQERAWRCVILDLELRSADALEVLQAVRAALPATPVVGYCSHTHAELQTLATAAGCSVVVPRSVFVRRLPALMAGTWPSAP